MAEKPPIPPAEFQLVCVKSETDSCPAPQPQRANAERKPSLEEIDKKVLVALDLHATQVAQNDHSSLRDLTWDLVFSKIIINKLEICRAIYVWLAKKDLNALSFDNVQPGSPEQVLMELQTDRKSYAVVFDTLCSYAGLHSKVIRGYTKGFDYRLGQKFQPGSNRNRGSWNAVYIDGTWCLIDVNWGARVRASKEELQYKFDEYFFLPDPAQLIYSHLPDDPEWQLLEQTITLEEFETMPYLKPPFFKYGLKLLNHKTVVICCHDEITIKIGYPTDKSIKFSFDIELETGEKECKGVSIKRYCMLENVEGVASLSLRPPQKDSYILSIFAREITSGNEDTKYELACKFKIVQEAVTSIEPAPFPPCSSLNWGLRGYFSRYGLSTSQQAAIIPTRDGKAKIQFTLPKLMTFTSVMKTHKDSDSELEGYCLIRVVDKTAYFDIAAPGRGEYGLEIYANDPTIQSSMPKVAQYLIQCNEDVNKEQLHKPYGGYLGARLKFFELGLNTVSHHDPFIQLEENSLEIKLSTKEEMRVTTKLINVETENEVSNFVFIETKSSVITLVVTLPAVGLYKLHLYANPSSDTNKELPFVFNYLINCTKITQQPYPFPKTYAGWDHGCYLETPLILKPESGEVVKFRVTVPKAVDIAVIANGKWTYLQSPQPDLWEGNVRLAGLYGKDVTVKLSAKYEENSASYDTLLKYYI